MRSLVAIGAVLVLLAGVVLGAVLFTSPARQPAARTTSAGPAPGVAPAPTGEASADGAETAPGAASRLPSSGSPTPPAPGARPAAPEVLRALGRIEARLARLEAALLNRTPAGVAPTGAVPAGPPARPEHAGTPAAPRNRYIERARTLLADPSATPSDVIRALGHLTRLLEAGNGAAFDLLQQALADPRPDVVAAALTLARKYGEVPDTARLAAWLTSASPELRKQALRTLANLPDDADVRALLAFEPALEDLEFYVKALANADNNARPELRRRLTEYRQRFKRLAKGPEGLYLRTEVDQGSLYVGSQIAKTLAPREIHLYRVQVTVMTFVRIECEYSHAAGDLDLALETPQGKEIAKSDGETGDERLALPLKPGEYVLRLFVAEHAQVAGPRYTLSLAEDVPATLLLGQPVRERLPAKGTAYYRLEIANPAPLAFALAGEPNAVDVDLYLFAADGEELQSSTDENGAEAFSYTCAAGRYFVRVTNLDDNRPSDVTLTVSSP